MVCDFDDENFKKSSFLSGDQLCIPRITWVPEPLRNVPHYSKIFGLRLPDHFCEMLGSGGFDVVKMAVLELRVHTLVQMVLLFPLVLYDSHFCLLTHALKMKPDGL